MHLPLLDAHIECANKHVLNLTFNYDSYVGQWSQMQANIPIYVMQMLVFPPYM